MSQILTHRQQIVRYLTAKIQKQRWWAWGLGLSSVAFVSYANATAPSSPAYGFQPTEPQYLLIVAVLYAMGSFCYIAYYWMVLWLRKVCKRPKLGIRFMARAVMAMMAGMILPADETSFLVNYWAKKKAGDMGEGFAEPMKEVEWAVPIDNNGIIIPPYDPEEEPLLDEKSRQIVASLGPAMAHASTIHLPNTTKLPSQTKPSIWRRMLSGPFALTSVSWLSTVLSVGLLLFVAEVGGAELFVVIWLVCGWYAHQRLTQ